MDDPTAKSWETVVIQIVLVLLVFVVSVGGNAAIGALLMRFKKLRTVPNLFIANMAMIDLLNAVINMPLYILYDVLQVLSIMRGKAIAFTVGTLHVLSCHLSLFMIVVIAADRYGAMVYGLKYMMWKTRQKAYIAIAVVCILSVGCTATNLIIPLRDINIPNGTVTDYRQALFRGAGRISALTTICVSMATIGILSVMTRRVIMRARKELSELQDLSSCVSQKRQQNEVKATNTMIVAFIASLLSYLPVIVHSICINKNFQVNVDWSRFCASLGMFVSSASNPIVYALRTRRFRHALGQLWKDPFGKSPLQEMKEERKPQKKKPSEQKENYRADSKDGKEEYTMESINQRGDCRTTTKEGSGVEELGQERKPQKKKPSEQQKENCRADSKDGKEECTMESIDQIEECRTTTKEGSGVEELGQERKTKTRAVLSERRKRNLKRASVGISENRRCNSI